MHPCKKVIELFDKLSLNKISDELFYLVTEFIHGSFFFSSSVLRIIKFLSNVKIKEFNEIVKWNYLRAWYYNWLGDLLPHNIKLYHFLKLVKLFEVIVFLIYFSTWTISMVWNKNKYKKDTLFDMRIFMRKQQGTKWKIRFYDIWLFSVKAAGEVSFLFLTQEMSLLNVTNKYIFLIYYYMTYIFYISNNRMRLLLSDNHRAVKIGCFNSIQSNFSRLES